MKKSFYYVMVGTIYGIGLAELSYSFGFLRSEFGPGVFGGLVFIVVTFLLWHYDERIMEKLGVKE